MLLAAAAGLLGVPWALKLPALAVLAFHGWVGRPGPPPASLLVAADGACCVPQWGRGAHRLGSRTRLTRFALDLELGPRGRRLLLLADQVEPEDWTRLQAVLRRASVK